MLFRSGDSGAAAAANAFRWFHAARKYAADGAGHYADMPTTHFVSLAQAILYRGAGFEIVWPQFLTLMAIGGAFFTIALLRFRKTIGTMA